MIWLRRVEMFFDYKFAYSTDSDCTKLFDVFKPADALHIGYPLEPITIYATKQEIDQYRVGLVRLTEIAEAQAMMEMVKNENLTNLASQSRQQCSSFEFEHNHMIDMIQKDMSGDAPGWKRSSSSVQWYTSTNIAGEFLPEAN